MSDGDISIPAKTSVQNVTRLSGIEALQATIVSEGRTMIIRQLQAGRAQCAAGYQRYTGIAMADDSVSRRVEFETTTLPDHVTFITHAHPTSIWLNRCSTSSENLLCLPPGTDLHGVTPENPRVLTIHVPITRLQEAGFDTIDAWTRLIDGSATSLEPAIANRIRLRHLHCMAHQPLSAIGQQHLASEVLDCLNSIVCAHVEAGGSIGISRDESHRVVNIAKRYIDANLHNDISMGHLCRVAATSLSKLERIFRRELQMSPRRYLHARRLDATRKVLMHSSSCSTRVVDVAMDNGFNHMGRFSGAYFQQFGELPSDTLRAS